MIHGTVQYSSVRPFARHHDGSFGTRREMEKTVRGILLWELKMKTDIHGGAQKEARRKRRLYWHVLWRVFASM